MGHLLLLVIASASITATIGFAVPPKFGGNSHCSHSRRHRTVLETNDSLDDPVVVLLRDVDETFILQSTPPAESPLPVSFDPSSGKVLPVRVEAEVAPMPTMPPMTTASLTERATEIKARLAKSSRPKKFAISTHSAFSTIVTAIFFAAVLPHLSPGIHGNGLPRLYDMANFDNAFLAKMTGLMFAISAVTGVLRLPPRTTKLRRLMFESCAWSTVLMYTLQDSNIFLIDGGYDLDLFYGPGWFVTFVVFVGTVISTLEYFVEGIAGPEDGRVRDGLPFAGNRLGMAFVSTFAYFGISPMSLTIPPWFFDRNPSAFAEIVVPGLHMVNGWNLSVNFIVEAYMGFGMLVSTLLYEKKLNQNQAAVLLLLDFFITGAYDQFAVLIPAKSMPEELVRIGEYAHSITLHLPINELFGGIWLVSLVKAMMELNTLRIANYNEQLRRQEAAALRVPVEVDEPTDMM